MRFALVLLLAAVVSGCGGESDAVSMERDRAAASLAECEPTGADGSRTYALCPSAGRPYAGRFFVADDRGARPLRVTPPGRVGHWSWASLSPDGSTFLAQWIAECEVPVAYFVATRGGTPRPVTTADVESIALGWSADGAARIAFPKGVCGASAERPGVYAVSPDGKRRFVRAFDADRDKVHA